MAKKKRLMVPERHCKLQGGVKAKQLSRAERQSRAKAVFHRERGLSPGDVLGKSILEKRE